MSKLIAASKTSPCPICQRTKSCSRDPETNVFFCLSEREDTQEFKYLYERGAFGIFVEEFTANFTQTRKTFARKLYKDPTPVIDKQDLATFYRSLTEVLGRLPLKPEHRTKLLARGMDDEAIAKGRYFSLTQYQKVEGATKYFPGFDSTGTYTNTSGLAIPALDFNGNILGFQIAPDRIVNKAKYKWTVHQELGASIPLNNAKILWGNSLELPLGMSLASFVANEYPLYLAEGLLKPAITAYNFNINVLGAAGGLFKQSPQQLKFYLDALKPTEIVWLADTGSGLNPHVWANIQKQAEFIRELGYEFKIADWGQLKQPKTEKLDCDEITPEFWGEFCTFKSLAECGEIAREYLGSSQSLKLLNKLYRGFGRITSSVKSKLKSKPSYIKKAGCFDFLKGAAIAKKNRSFVHTFKPQDRQRVVARLIQSQQKYILDSSDMGSGKSYATGLYKAEDFTLATGQAPTKLWYLSKQHRSPSTTTLEDNYVQYPTKHGGLFSHPTKLTPNGNPIFMREKHKDSQHILQSNCSYYGKQAELIAANSSLSLCRQCPIKAQCSKEFEPGSHGYLYQQNTIMANYREISANLKGLNPNLIGETDVAFIDEASQSIPFTKDIVVSIQQIENAIPRFQQVLGEDFKLLEPAIAILKGDDLQLDLSFQQSLYGLTLAEYLEQHGDEQPLLLHKASQIATVEALINEQRAEDRQSPILEFGRYLFLALSGLDRTVSATLVKGKLTLTVKNQEIVEHLNQFNTVFFMDATLTQKDLAMRLGCEVEDILVIAQETPADAYQNVVVFQNQALGVMGAIRSEKVQQNTQTIRESLEARYQGQIGVIDKKAYSQKGDLDHFSDARGSNAFEAKKALAIVGTANMNVNAAKAEFEVVTGLPCDRLNHDAFVAFYAAKQQAETLQEIGRLRATRRPDEQLDIHIISTADLGYLNDHNIKVVQVSGGEFHESLDNNYDRLIKRLLKLKEDGLDFSKLSIRKIAKMVDMPKSTMHDQIMGSITELEADLSCGEKIEQLISQILDDPTLLLYYTGKVLAAASQLETRKELVSTTLKILALVKEGMKEELKKQSVFTERIIKLAEDLQIPLTAFNIIELEKQLK